LLVSDFSALGAMPAFWLGVWLGAGGGVLFFSDGANWFNNSLCFNDSESFQK